MDARSMVPIIDFSAYSLGRENVDEKGIEALVSEVHNALTTVGCMYLKNFGLAPQLVEDAFRDSKKFFDLPLDVKIRFEKPKGHHHHGYQRMEGERMNLDVPFEDLKEAFNYHGDHKGTRQLQTESFPDDVLPDFGRSLRKLFAEVTPLHNRILEVMGRGLGLEDPLLFVKEHSNIGDEGNDTTLRTAYYPPLSGVTINEGQLRCGEHQVWSGVSLMFEDDQTGLEVKNLQGEWVAASPIEGTVFVVMGAAIERWTADVYKSLYVRVSVPHDDAFLQQARQSLVYYGIPNDDTIIKCVDNSDKYPPIQFGEFFKTKITY